MERLPIRNALLSVSDKTDLVPFASFLAENGVRMISTGGTWGVLHAAGIPTIEVSKLTGSPEILDGRVKTLHLAVFAGILADKERDSHLEQLAQLGVEPIDLVCVNFADFQTNSRHLPSGEAVDMIDTGGSCLLRAAAKNYGSVLALSAPEDYRAAMDEMRDSAMCVSLAFRRDMAVRAFASMAEYDTMIADYLR